MNKNVVRALFDDALAQVLDNLGFRILAVLFLILVLPAWLIGFREDGITLLFHWHFAYADFMAGDSMPSGAAAVAELRHDLLARVENLVLDGIADKFGILFSVAAVSFFVPRLLEKGAADTVFSKPVSRLALMLSRYVAGLLFIFFLATLLIGGMYLGFRVVSGYDDKGLLWGIATLTYGFAIFHAISVLIGVFTRSTVAAVLIVAIFMPINCGIHNTWKLKETGESFAKQQQAAAKPTKTPDPTSSAATDESAQSGAVKGLLKTLVFTLNALHYTLPKTTDTTLIAKDLRKRLDNEEKEYVDSDTTLTVAVAPPGYAREQRSSPNREGLLWIAPHPAGLGEARWTLKKQKVSDTGSRLTLLKALRKRVAEDPNCSDYKSEHSDIGGHSSERVQWHEKRGDESRLRREWSFQDGDYMFTLDYDAELEWAQDKAQEHSAQVFVAGLRFAPVTQGDPLDADYEKRFGWHSELKYNAWFSIGSTLAFIVFVLAIAWWKLARTDF